MPSFLVSLAPVSSQGASARCSTTANLKFGAEQANVAVIVVIYLGSSGIYHTASDTNSNTILGNRIVLLYDITVQYK